MRRRRNRGRRGAVRGDHEPGLLRPAPPVSSARPGQTPLGVHPLIREGLPPVLVGWPGRVQDAPAGCRRHKKRRHAGTNGYATFRSRTAGASGLVQWGNANGAASCRFATRPPLRDGRATPTIVRSLRMPGLDRRSDAPPSESYDFSYVKMQTGRADGSA